MFGDKLKLFTWSFEPDFNNTAELNDDDVPLEP
jgi:hypothetical protein